MSSSGAGGAPRRGWPSLVAFVLLTLAAAAGGALFPPGQWYAELTKPAWTPPNWLFGPAWTLLYGMIATAGWLVWRRDRRAPALGLWLVQMILNGLWSWLFFGLHRPDWALVDIGLLLATIVTFIVVARKTSGVASVLFVPYFLWVSFATALNFSILRLNGL